MKKLLHLIKKHFLISLSNTGLFIVFIWLIGPLIAIDNQVLFQTVENKILASLIILAAWVSYFLIRFPNFKHLLHTHFVKTQAEKQDSLNHNELKAVWQRLKQLNPNMPATIPLYVLLGDANTGKTRFMASGKCLDMSQQIGEIDSTRTMRWWQYNDMLIAIPAPHMSDTQWQQWLTLFSRWHNRLPLIGITAMIDAPSLCQIHTKNTLKHEQFLKQYLSAFTVPNQQPPLYFLVSKCDLIQGFDEFFADLGGEERLGRFGIDLNSHTNSKRRDKLVAEQSQSFLKRLSERLIFRAHQETDTDRRKLIYNFPTQMNAITEQLQKIFSNLPHLYENNIEGIYFSSSIQQGFPQNQLMHTVGAELCFTPSISREELPWQKPFFVQDTLNFLKKLGQFNLPTKKKRSTWQLASYPISAVALSIVMFSLNHSYETNNQLIANVNQQLLTFASQQNDNNPAITKLNALNVAYNSLVNQEAKADKWVVLNQAKELTKETDHAYHSSLRSVLIPVLDSELVSALQEGIKSSPAKTYQTLKIYFMLTNPQFRDNLRIGQWFNQYWQQHLPNQITLQNQLSHHLQNLLAENNIDWPTHATLTQNAQQQLRALKPETLGMLLLEQETKNQAVPIILASHSQTQAPTAKIPAIYTEAFFSQIYHQYIPELTEAMKQGDWVIGQTNTLTTSETTTLTQNLQQQYLQDYHDYWQAIFNHIRFKPTDGLAAIDQQIQELQQPKSVFWQWMQLITDNTSPINNEEHFNSIVTNDFTELHQLSTDHSALADLNPEFDAFHQLMQSILNAHNVNKASYAVSVDRYTAEQRKDALSALLNASEDLPKPLQQWLQTLLTHSWTIILNNAQTYLNDLWTKNVVPEYDEKINNKFPLFANAKPSIKRNDFSNFFGPNGTIDAFFNYYLKPFVDTSHFYWHWKKLDGQSIDIPQPTLETFIRSSLITRMFYTDSGRLQIKFRLTPLSLSKNSNAFQLDVDGQSIVFDKINKEPTDLLWPGSAHSKVKMQFFSDNENDNAILIDSGDWSLFRFLNESHLIKTGSATQYFVSFKLDNHTARYQLDADQLVNPFIPDILTSFRCPETLLAHG